MVELQYICQTYNNFAYKTTKQAGSLVYTKRSWQCL